ncbi:hypothetical protein [Actinomyces radicidentis]|uniref:hypothetical protein n=1 Tax=Actinomyces radicidentis TaxID=111015 RepID=UPI0028F0B48C|nr:hypothetical protein [Actinomyces radicidentis]
MTLDFKVGDYVATPNPAGRPGDLLASGTVHRIVECKDHTRAYNRLGALIARSDFPHTTKEA